MMGITSGQSWKPASITAGGRRLIGAGGMWRRKSNLKAALRRRSILTEHAQIFRRLSGSKASGAVKVSL
jgi:hypothetical protein